MSQRRLAALAGIAIAGLAFLVLIGRWERQRHADEETSGMLAVVRAVGGLDSPDLAGFRYFRHFQCLAYRRPAHPLALEVCVDPEGRVVEAIDRRSGEPEIWSLRHDPAASDVRVDREEVDRLLLKMGVPRRLIREAHEQGSA